MKVELLETFGDDLMVVNAARVSYGKRKEVFDEKDERLLKYLVEHKHTSPFRHPQLQYRIQCPIFVERQLFKHQVGLTANSISGRYVDFSDEYWLPTQLRLQSKSSKQGSDGNLDAEENEKKIKTIRNLVHLCASHYKVLVDAGVSKEQARMILPLCLETQFIWTGSLAAFVHLFKLRIKPDAQQETREVAEEMLRLLKETGKFAKSLEAFGF